MEFKEVNNALYQVIEDIRTMHRDDATQHKARYICRIPVEPCWDRESANVIFKLLPGYSIRHPHKIEIDTSGYFAYLTYDTIYHYGNPFTSFFNFGYVCVESSNTLEIKLEDGWELIAYSNDMAEYQRSIVDAGVIIRQPWFSVEARLDTLCYGAPSVINYYFENGAFVEESWESPTEYDPWIAAKDVTEKFIVENY